MESSGFVSTCDLDLLRTALVEGEVSLFEIEQALRARLSEEWSKPTFEVDAVLVERIEEMLEMSSSERIPASQRVVCRSYEELIQLVKQKRF